MYVRSSAWWVLLIRIFPPSRCVHHPPGRRSGQAAPCSLSSRPPVTGPVRQPLSKSSRLLELSWSWRREDPHGRGRRASAARRPCAGRNRRLDFVEPDPATSPCLQQSESDAAPDMTAPTARTPRLQSFSALVPICWSSGCRKQNHESGPIEVPPLPDGAVSADDLLWVLGVVDNFNDVPGGRLGAQTIDENIVAASRPCSVFRLERYGRPAIGIGDPDECRLASPRE